MKASLLEDRYNYIAAEPYTHALYWLNQYLTQYSYTKQQEIDTISSITLQDVQGLLMDIFSRDYHIDAYVYGDVIMKKTDTTAATSILVSNIYKLLKTHLIDVSADSGAEDLSPSLYPLQHVAILPAGTTQVVLRENFNAHEPNAAIVVFFPITQRSNIRECVLIDLINAYLGNEPFNDVINTHSRRDQTFQFCLLFIFFV
jgi:secreted Zn-dependent insulinase-like peptidase